MKTSTFRVHGLQAVEQFRELVMALRYHNIPPEQHGYWEVWVDHDARGLLEAQAEYQALRNRDVLGLLVSEVPMSRHVSVSAFATILGCALFETAKVRYRVTEPEPTSRSFRLPNLPACAFPLRAGQVGPAIESLRLSWDETVGSVVLLRPV